MVTRYEMSPEDELREQLWAMEDYYRTWNTFITHLRKGDQIIEQQEQEIAQKNQQIDQLESEVQRLKALLEKRQEK